MGVHGGTFTGEIIDFLPDATFAIDLDGVVIAWNRAIEEMTGVAAAAVLGKGDCECSLPFWVCASRCRPSRHDVTSSYISQSSHPDWFAARVGAGILPGCGAFGLIRQLETNAERARLEVPLGRYPPDSAAMARLPATPKIVDLTAVTP